MVSKGKDLLSLTKMAMHEKWILASELTAHAIEQRLTAHECEKEIPSYSQSKGKMGVRASVGTCRVLVCSLHLSTSVRVLLPLIFHLKKMPFLLLWSRLAALNWSV